MENPRDESEQDSMVDRKRADSIHVRALSLTPCRARTTFPSGPKEEERGDLVVIANCPSCGTHYKHEPPKAPVRARCGRCATTLDLGRLRPYRFVPALAPTKDQARRAARHLPIGLDHPALATQIAVNVAQSPAPEIPRPTPVLIPVQTSVRSEEPKASVVSEPVTVRDHLPGEAEPANVPAESPESSSNAGGVGATFALWLAAGAIAGTGASWTLGGTTLAGSVAGVAVGALAGWAWRRWTSPK